MATLIWILGSGLLMAVIALSGSITAFLREETRRKLTLPLVAFAAGSLLGGAFFHLIPEAIDERRAEGIFIWVLAGFTVFFLFEQFLHVHHCHTADHECVHVDGHEHRLPMAYLILLGDGLHNLLGGLAVAAAFIKDVRIGIVTWLAAAAHEIPQELGDFGILIHGGMPRARALAWNFISGLTFVVGGIAAYCLSFQFDVAPLLAFSAGNFIYIGASDLVPEINKPRDFYSNATLFFSFAAGIAMLAFMRVILGHGG